MVFARQGAAFEMSMCEKIFVFAMKLDLTLLFGYNLNRAVSPDISINLLEAVVLKFNVEKCNQLLKNPPAPTTLRVFFWLALNQHDQTGFVRTTKKYLAQMLGIDAKTLYDAMQWLQDSYIVHQLRCKGYFEFMISPYYVEWGNDRDLRLKEWNRRWAEHRNRRNRKLSGND